MFAWPALGYYWLGLLRVCPPSISMMRWEQPDQNVRPLCFFVGRQQIFSVADGVTSWLNGILSCRRRGIDSNQGSLLESNGPWPGPKSMWNAKRWEIPAETDAFWGKRAPTHTNADPLKQLLESSEVLSLRDLCFRLSPGVRNLKLDRRPLGNRLPFGLIFWCEKLSLWFGRRYFSPTSSWLEGCWHSCQKCSELLSKASESNSCMGRDVAFIPKQIALSTENKQLGRNKHEPKLLINAFVCCHSGPNACWTWMDALWRPQDVSYLMTRSRAENEGPHIQAVVQRGNQINLIPMFTSSLSAYTILLVSLFLLVATNSNFTLLFRRWASGAQGFNIQLVATKNLLDHSHGASRSNATRKVRPTWLRIKTSTGLSPSPG